MLATANRNIQPAQGNLVLSTVAPLVAATGGVVVVPAAGDLVLSTQPPTAVVTIVNPVIEPDTAQLVLSSTAPTVVRTTVEPETGLIYDFPIGRSLRSDYGIRASKMRRGRYVIGRR